MSEAIQAVLQRVEWAKEKRLNLEKAIVAFASTNPYLIGQQKDEQTGKTIFYVGKVASVPASVSNLAGETIHTIRTILDHLVFQLFVTRNPTKDGSAIDFPIYDPAKNTESEAFRKIKPLGEDVIKAIREFKPYKGGNDILWTLHRLDIIDKHRRILTSTVSHNRIKVADTIRELLRERGFGDMAMLINPAATVSTRRFGKAAEEGDILFVGEPIDAEHNEYLKFTYDITINEPGIIEGKSLLGTVEDMCNMVEAIVRCFDSFFE